MLTQLILKCLPTQLISNDWRTKDLPTQLISNDLPTRISTQLISQMPACKLYFKSTCLQNCVQKAMPTQLSTRRPVYTYKSVSYTHLTLPTSVAV